MAKFDVPNFHLLEYVKSLCARVLPDVIANSIPFRLLRSWVFQGVLYMHWRELVFRCLGELLLVAVLWLAGCIVFVKCVNVFVILVIAHTVMWLFDGHLWALSIGDGQRLVRNKPERILTYLRGLHGRLERTSSVDTCVIFGSLSRGEFTENSDLDVLCCRKLGMLSTVRAYSAGVRERAIAFARRIPIELYFYDLDDFAGLDEKERPLLIKDIYGAGKVTIGGGIGYEEYPFHEQHFFSTLDRASSDATFDRKS